MLHKAIQHMLAFFWGCDVVLNKIDPGDLIIDVYLVLFVCLFVLGGPAPGMAIF